MRKFTLIVGAALALMSPVSFAAEISNPYDLSTGDNTYIVGFSDGNWIESIGGATPNVGDHFFASANGNSSGSFSGIGIIKELGGTIEDKVYRVSFYITKYYAELSGVEFSDFDALKIGGANGDMNWRSTPAPTENAEWVKWSGIYTPSVSDVGSSFQFTAVFNLDAQHAIGLDGPVEVSILACGGKKPTIVGTDDADFLVGTSGEDVIVGLGGNDAIYGLGGQDVICGGMGHDMLFGGAHRDRIFGDEGDDIIHGQHGYDSLFGSIGNDTLRGGGQNDRIYGGPGNDTLSGGTGVDRMDGGPGQDVCDGNGDSDIDLGNCEILISVP